MSTDTAIDFELVHRLRVEPAEGVWGEGCRAVCSCGWASGWLACSEDATGAGAAHVDTTIGPADAMDRAMAVMLDLQDDLADTVVWLAENWSADLPVPKVYGGMGRIGGEYLPGAELMVYCQTPEELARVAARLGVPVIAAPHYGSDCECGKAIRDFGLVRVDAYTLTPATETAR